MSLAARVFTCRAMGETGPEPPSPCIPASIRVTFVCPCQGGILARADSDLGETSEVEEERERPEIGSESESSTYGPTKKKKKRPKEKREKRPRKKKRDEDDEDDDDDDGNMKVSVPPDSAKLILILRHTKYITSRYDDGVRIMNFEVSFSAWTETQRRTHRLRGGGVHSGAPHDDSRRI